MPLPKEGTLWPPREWAAAWDRYRLNEAIWMMDNETLAKLVGAGAKSSPSGNTVSDMRKRRGMLLNMVRRWFWAQQPPAGEKRTDLPVPIGRNIVDLSAAQLMAEPPRFRFVEEDTARPGHKVTVKRGNNSVQSRLDTIGNSDDAHMTLIEGAQLAAALGGTVLKASWDVGDPDRESVWFDVVGADAAVPEFNAHGRLIGVMLWQEYMGPGSKVYRHIERHAPGQIEHALYLGTETSIGKLVKLTEVEPLADMLSTIANPVVVDDVLQVITGIERVTAAFWRNRPTIGWRRMGGMAYLGRSDFELLEPAIDAYGEAWGSLMRDVRLGKARLLVPLGMLAAAEAAGGGGTFDGDREIYAQIGGLSPEAGTNTIKDYQAAIRFQEHLGVLAGIKYEILDGAGWSLSSYGNPAGGGSQGGGQITATEVNDRTTKSERTRDEKALLFKQPGNGFMRMLMELDGVLYPGRGDMGDLPELAIDFPDISQVDPEKQARRFLALSQASAISVEQTVRELHPNWDDDDIADEVERILGDLERANPPLADPARLDLTDPTNPTPPEPAADREPADA